MTDVVMFLLYATEIKKGCHVDVIEKQEIKSI
jgi:hypothetical protein